MRLPSITLDSGWDSNGGLGQRRVAQRLSSLTFQADYGDGGPISDKHLKPKERPQETKSNSKRERTQEHDKNVQLKKVTHVSRSAPACEYLAA